MPISEYEKLRNENVRNNDAVFQSFGLPGIAKSVNTLFSKKKGAKCKKIITEKAQYDHDYDPGSEIDRETDQDDTDLEEDDLAEVR